MDEERTLDQYDYYSQLIYVHKIVPITFEGEDIESSMNRENTVTIIQS